MSYFDDDTAIISNHFRLTPCHVGGLLLLFFLSFPLLANPEPFDLDAAVEKANSTISTKLDYYNRTFPQIQFVHLKNHQEWYMSIQALELLLGYQSTSLDFEHPSDVREALLFATVEKIHMMLVNKLTSSYLFKTGQVPAAKKHYVCVMTIDPATTVISDRVATEYFIDLPLDELPDARLVDKDQHLDFIIDHEAYHCLDTFYYSGIPMSQNTYSTQHEVYRREKEADMFALAMHIRRQEALTDYASKIIQLRGMSLLNGEPQHFSAIAMQRVFQHDKQTIIDATTDELLKRVKRLYRPLSQDYQQYLQYRRNAVAAIHELGKQLNELDVPLHPDGVEPQPARVREMVRQTKQYYSEFFGETYPSLE